MKHVQINDTSLDLRALEQVIKRRAEQEIELAQSLSISSGAWLRERAYARKEAYETVLMDIRFAIRSHQVSK